MRVRVFADAEHFADAAAEEIAAWIRHDAPIATVGLAGGTTPRGAYEALARTQVPWRRVHLWLTDERAVPPGHIASNTGMVRRALADHVPALFHAVPWREQPAETAAAYAAELAGFLPMGPRGWQPGLVVLGLGEDGHTASLFPGTDALEERRPGFVPNWVPELSAWRLTATLPLLAAARRTVFLATGKHKAAVVAQVLSGDSNLPAARVSRESRDAVWLLDREAASRLAD